MRKTCPTVRLQERMQLYGICISVDCLQKEVVNIEMNMCRNIWKKRWYYVNSIRSLHGKEEFGWQKLRSVWKLQGIMKKRIRTGARVVQRKRWSLREH